MQEADAGDAGSIPVSGRPPGGGNGSALQSSCLDNLMDREARLATVHGVSKSWTRLRDDAHAHAYVTGRHRPYLLLRIRTPHRTQLIESLSGRQIRDLIVNGLYGLFSVNTSAVYESMRQSYTEELEVPATILTSNV